MYKPFHFNKQPLCQYAEGGPVKQVFNHRPDCLFFWQPLKKEVHDNKINAPGNGPPSYKGLQSRVYIEFP
jgi:hypothetical protein